MALQTEFAPAERVSEQELQRQYDLLKNLPFVGRFLDAVPNMALVLNEFRQIVFANQAFRDFVGAGSVEELLGNRQGEVMDCIHASYIGKRPGEAVGCVRSDLTEGGCGTTVFCRTCGAVRSILNAQQSHDLDIQECRMICGEEENPLDLRVWSRPLEVEGESFTVFSVSDISDEKRRKALERIFFHDVLNTAGGVKGLADLIIESGMSEVEVRDIAGMISESADQLIEEIAAQRMLSAAERGDLHVDVRTVDSRLLMERVIRQFHSFNVAEGKTLNLDVSPNSVSIESDPVLLRRVLVNLTKNALESTPLGAAVTLSAYVSEGGWACFSVHNPTYIPADVQRQIFARSFSTKGSGRGLGTYSIKLITEKYLQGRVAFSSSKEEGTVFTVCYPPAIQSVSGEDNG